MKELTIEEKAKAYDEAKARMSKAYNSNRCTIGFMNEIFPELKKSEDEIIKEEIIDFLRLPHPQFVGKRDHEEWIAWLEKQSEKDKLIQELGEYKVKYTQETLERALTMNSKDDERLRKTTISFLKEFADKGYENAFECIAWLEKQGEQKPAEVEPKFNVGDWIVDNNVKTPFLITDTSNGKYDVVSIYGEDMVFSSNEVERFYHPWTIQDAKDGDVLHVSSFSSDCIFIFDRLDKWKFDEPNGERAVATGHCCLTLSADNIEFGIQGPDCIEVDTVKPATNIQRNLLEKAIADAGYTFDFDKKELKKIEPTECSEDNLPEFESYLCLMFQKFRIEFSTKGVCTNGEIIDFVMEHAQKLKDTLCYAWSAEDEKAINDILWVIEAYRKNGFNECHKQIANNAEKWLKSLRPQSQWKPSATDIIVLEGVIDEGINPINYHATLHGILEQLKKLMEE